MKIDIRMPQAGMTRDRLIAYLYTLREAILYVADQINKTQEEEE